MMFGLSGLVFWTVTKWQARCGGLVTLFHSSCHPVCLPLAMRVLFTYRYGLLLYSTSDFYHHPFYLSARRRRQRPRPQRTLCEASAPIKHSGGDLSHPSPLSLPHRWERRQTFPPSPYRILRLCVARAHASLGPCASDPCIRRLRRLAGPSPAATV